VLIELNLGYVQIRYFLFIISNVYTCSLTLVKGPYMLNIDIERVVLCVCGEIYNCFYILKLLLGVQNL